MTLLLTSAHLSDHTKGPCVLNVHILANLSACHTYAVEVSLLHQPMYHIFEKFVI